MTYFSNTGSQPYILAEQPIELPITLAELKAWLKITNNAQNTLLINIIKAVTLSAEAYTKRDFIVKNYITYRDFFGDIGENPAYDFYPAQIANIENNWPITIRKSPFNELEQIEYIDKDNQDQVFDNQKLYVINKESYSQIGSMGRLNWPAVTHDRQQAVKLSFSAGYGATSADIPEDIKQALLAHAAYVFKNRGDCSSSSCDCSTAPSTALATYNQYRIIDFVA